MSLLDLFFANDGAHGFQLYATNGTTVTALTNFPAPVPTPLTMVDGVGYFVAPVGSGGAQFQLWRSDGTAAGTFALGLSGDSLSAAPQVAQVGSTVLYIGQDASHSEALFASVDGQAGQFVSQLGQTPDVSFSLTFLGSAGAEALLQVGGAVWVSDGTAAGTHALSDGESNPALQSALAPVLFNGADYFQGIDANNVSQLFELSGGSASVVPQSVVGAAPSQLAALPGHLVYISNGDLESRDGVSPDATQLFSQVQTNVFLGQVGDQFYFEGPDPAQAGSDALFVTDGTVAGTHEVAEGDFDGVVDLGSRLVLVGSGHDGLFVSDGTVAGTAEAESSIGIDDLTKVGDRAFYMVGSNQLWVTDGTAAGTREVMGGLDFTGEFSAQGEELVFGASTDGVNYEPWVSDGTASGTHMIADIQPRNSGYLPISDETAFGNGVAFVSNRPADATGPQIWVSDGTVAGTGAIQTAQFPAGPLVAAGGKLFFFVDNLYLTVASSAAPGASSTTLGSFASPEFMVAFDNKLFFYSDQGGAGSGLYQSDGTSAGTTQVANLTVLNQPVVVGADLVFIGSNGADGEGIFKSDGTSAGTTFLGAILANSNITSFTLSGSKAYVVAGNGDTGSELWVTDGTAGGTQLVKEFTPGPVNADPSNLTAFAGGVIFNMANDNGQVWFSNGTTAGTFQLSINQTHDPAASLQIGGGMAQFDGKAFFISNNGLDGDQLWSTNGTTAGTAEVAELGPNIPTIAGGSFLELGTKLLIGDNGQLWISDGTAAGTTRLQPPGAFDMVDTAPVLVNGKAYFTALMQGQAAPDLYVTDGTNTGSHDLATLAQNTGFSVAGNELFFRSSDATDGAGLFAYDTATQTKTFLHAIPQGDAYVVKVGSQIEVGTPANGPTGNNLWVTDGTAAGTTELTNLANNIALTNFTALDGDVYFSSFGGNQGFWVTDGTAAGTHEIQANLDVLPDTFEVIGGNLFFHAMDAGVERVFFYVPSTKVLTEVPSQSVGSPPIDLVPVGSGAFFVASDATSPSELWHADNMGNVTELTSPTDGEVSGPLAAVGANLFFAGTDSVHGQGLFITDGSTVTFLAQVNDATDFSAVGSDLYFLGSDGVNGAELWVSDGTAGGTHRVTDTEAPGGATGAGFTAVGSKMFFAADDGVHGEELWVFNGQAGGASMVTDLDPGSAGSSPTELTALGSDVYFAASNGSGPLELWRSDGTAAGTVAISTAADGAAPQDLTAVGSELFYFGSDSAHGSGLFVTNGAAAPTFLRAFETIADVSVEGGKLFFQGGDASGAELWVSNGTAAGTLKLSTTGLDPGSDPNDLTSLGANFTPRQDFNDDSRSDFLIENTSGAVVVGESTHGQTHFTTVAGLGSEWSFKGDADFLGDGHQDFLIENGGGTIAVGDVSGGKTTYTAVGGLGSEWSFRGVGDFLGLGKSQFLIENTAGAVVVGDVVNGQANYADVAALGPEWKFVGTGDFLGDGRGDFLIQNTSGAVVIGEVLNGAARYTSVVGLGHEWKFVGTGDFLGEGHDQFLIENTNGAVDIGDWSNGQIHFTQVTALGAEWKFVGAGDFLGEGHDQFLIENTAGAVDVGDWLNGQTHFTQLTALGPEWAFH